jgi:hypothetical protein
MLLASTRKEVTSEAINGRPTNKPTSQGAPLPALGSRIASVTTSVRSRRHRQLGRLNHCIRLRDQRDIGRGLAHVSRVESHSAAAERSCGARIPDQAVHLVPVREQGPHYPAADKPGGASNQHPHDCSQEPAPVLHDT